MKPTPTYDEVFQQVLLIDKDAEILEQAVIRMAEGLRIPEHLLDALSAHLAILDEKGIILKTNRAWQNFALENSIGVSPDTAGMSYLDLCDSAHGEESATARRVAQGLRSVISGKRYEFVVDYACHGPARKRWFYLRAIGLAGPGPARIAVIHKDITALKAAMEVLNEREAKLKERQQELQDTNTALRVLLKQKELDERVIEERVLNAVEDLVKPYLEKLKSSGLKPHQRSYIDVIESNLNEILSPFYARMSSEMISLTPQELRVAALVRKGRTSKEIAEILNSSVSTVDFHRKKLRRKLGIKGAKVNLRSYLLSQDAPTDEHPHRVTVHV